MLSKLDIVVELSAVKLDPRTFQKFEPVGGNNPNQLGMSIGQDQMKMDLGKMIEAGHFANIESNQTP